MRVVSINKKTMPDKTPGTGFFIATHHPECQAWSLRVLFFYPRPLASGSLIRLLNQVTFCKLHGIKAVTVVTNVVTRG